MTIEEKYKNLINSSGIKGNPISVVTFLKRINNAIDDLEEELDITEESDLELIEDEYMPVINKLQEKRDILTKELSKINIEIMFNKV